MLKYLSCITQAPLLLLKYSTVVPSIRGHLHRCRYITGIPS